MSKHINTSDTAQTAPRSSARGSTPVLRRSLVMCVALGVAGCQTTTTPAVQPAPQNTQQTISAAGSVSLFETICGGALPNFKSAVKRMKANGIDQPSPLGTSTLYSASGNVSFKILDGPGSGKNCSMVLTTTEPKSKIKSAIARLGPFKETALGMTAGYNNALVLSRVTTAPNDDNVLNLRMLSTR